MRILFKLLMKLAIFVGLVKLSALGLKHGFGVSSGGSGSLGNVGADGAPVTQEESDLRVTVLKSAGRLVTGQASRNELAKELSDKLYGQRGDPSDMQELGIELVAPSGSAPAPPSGGNTAAAPSPGQPGGKPDHASGAKPGENQAAGTVAPPKGSVPGTSGQMPVGTLPGGPELISGKGKKALAELWPRMKGYAAELSAIPVVFIGMIWVARVRRRRMEAGFVPDYMAVLPESDSEKYTMKHRVHTLTPEEFELLVAVIYQRQGYRISMPSALNRGRSSRFKLARKSERLLVQTHNFKNFYRIEVKLVQELHEAMMDANMTGGLFVASCGYTWDARHFAKTRNIKLISAKTLDILLTEARATPDEKLLTITPWLPKFMTKVEMTTPHCLECGAEMDEVKTGDDSAWLCNQRPECGGRSDVRKYRKGMLVGAQDGGPSAEEAAAPQPGPESAAAVRDKPGSNDQGPQQTKRTAKLPAKEVEASGIPPASSAAPRNPTPKTQVAVAGQTPVPKENEGEEKRAAARIPGATIPEKQPASMLGTTPAKQTPARESAEGKALARSVIPGRLRTPAHVPKGNELKNLPPAPPKAEPVAEDSNPRKKNASKGSTAPAPVVGPKQNGGLLNSVAEEFRRRGFRLEEIPLPTTKPVPGPTQARDASRLPERSKNLAGSRSSEAEPKQKAERGR
jgi:hypothetical protein